MSNDVQNETGECYDEQSVNIDQVSLSNQLCVAVKLIAETPKEFWICRNLSVNLQNTIFSDSH